MSRFSGLCLWLCVFAQPLFANDQLAFSKPENSKQLAASSDAAALNPSTQFAQSSTAKHTKAPEQNSDWMGEVQKNLAAREYHVSQNENGLQAPNRAQGFRSYFDASGVSVSPREPNAEKANTQEIKIALVEFGRSKSIQKASAGKLTHDAGKVIINRGAISEWYVNTPAGLEQGFDIALRPKGKGDLTLNLKIKGASAEQNGDDIILRSATQSYGYSKLLVLDANKKTIPASMLATQTGIAITVQDAHAQYPLTIDPLLTATADAQLESNQTFAQLGWSVAGAGDVNGDGYADVIVGVVLYDNGQADEGAAFIYFGGAGAFNTVADALLESNQSGSRFGWSVAGAGDVNGDGYADVIVGARIFNNGQNQEGAAFIFFGGAGPFDTAHDGLLEANISFARLGSSVAGAGDVNGDGYADVIVGAPNYELDGAALIFFGGAGLFNTTHDALLDAFQAGTEFGVSVAGAGDVNGDGYDDVIVGATTHDNVEINEGAAFIYFGSSGTFNTAHDAQLESNQAGALFGISVAGAGDVNGDGYADVIVGAHRFDNGETDEGAAFIYFGGAGVFNTAHDALLEANQADARLGESVAGAGDVNGDGYADVIVGAAYFDNGQPDEGAAFIFFGGAGLFNTVHDALLVTNQAEAYLGLSVAGAGDVNGDGYADVIVGATQFDNGETDEGAAFIYFGGAGAFNTAHNAQLESNQVSAQAGFSVAGAGDVNGDGYADVIVGAPYYDNGQTNEGAAFICFGGAGAFNIAHDALLESNQTEARFGVSVAAAGDVNGDGYADVIIGAHSYDNGQNDEGAAFVYFGGAGVFDTTADALLEANQADALFGFSVAGAGDVNGDGYADVIVGSIYYDNGHTDEGGAFIYFGGAGAFNTGVDAALESNQGSAFLGHTVASAGDVNGDGYADVIVTADGFDNGEINEGAAFIYFGGAGVFNTTADAQLESNQANAELGFSAAGAGDVNGDGYADVIVGARSYDNGETDEGAAFIYLGGTGAFDTTHDAQLESNQAAAYLGTSVAAAGDVNGDGYADVMVGAPSYDNGHADEGAVFIYYGGAAAFNTTADAQLESNQSNAQLGISVAGAGDVNGDGYADVIVGAYVYDNGHTDEGAAFMYYGTANGRLVLANQYRGDGSSVQMQPWSLSRKTDGFVAALNATSPRGRERARLQVQACRNGLPFGSAQCQTFTQNAWTAIPANAVGVSLVHTVSGLLDNTVYHWRARVQYAPLTITAAGITSPPAPSSGPWRRLQANADVADLRTTPDGIFQNGFEQP